MASLYSIRTGSVALTAAATKSLILANPATDGFKVVRLSVSVDGSAAAAGIGIELYRVTTIGSPAGTTGTQVKMSDPNQSASGVTSLTALSAEPTAVEVIEDWFISPFSGLLVIDWPLGREPLAAAAGQRIGVRYTTPAAVSPNCRAVLTFEEQ